MKIFAPTLSAIAVLTAISGSTSVFANDAAMNKANTDIETLVVSGNKSEQNLGDVAGSISVMTHEEMQKQVVIDMKDIFKYQPGVTVTGGSGEAQNIVVRGMGGDRVLMIKDGMRMNEGYGANGQNDVVGRGFVETSILKQVEVSKSAASSLYGSDAIGGVVIFTTKDPADLLKGDNSYVNLNMGYAGASSQQFIGFTGANSSGNFEQLLSATYREGNETQNFNDDLNPVDVESYDIFYKGVYNFSVNDRLKFTADVWQQDVDSPYAIYGNNFRSLPGYSVLNEFTKAEQENTSFKVSYHSELTNSWYDTLNVALYHTNTLQDDEEYFEVGVKDSPYGPDSFRNIAQYSKYEQETIGFLSNASKNMVVGGINNTFGFGIDIESTNSLRTVHEYRLRDGDVDRDIHTNKFPENDTLRAGIFINNVIELGKLTLTPGLRFDYYDMVPKNAENDDSTPFKAIDEHQLSPSLGAVYKFNPKLSVYGQFAQGFKVPPYDLAYIDHNNVMAGYKVIPTDHLDPERSDSFEIGFRGHVGNFAFTSAIFHNQYDDFINTALIATESGVFGPVQVFQYENIESVTIEGAELGVTYYIGDNWSLYGNTSYMDGENDDTGNYIASITPLSGTAGIAYDNENWGIDSVLRWASSMKKVNDGEHKTTGFGAVDLIAYLNMGNDFKVNMRIGNLFDKEYVQHYNIAGSEEGVELNSFTEVGRNLSVSMHYTF
jgi:hemoglobin/transferrin/lactoferrin receptor protein